MTENPGSETFHDNVLHVCRMSVELKKKNRYQSNLTDKFSIGSEMQSSNDASAYLVHRVLVRAC